MKSVEEIRAEIVRLENGGNRPSREGIAMEYGRLQALQWVLKDTLPPEPEPVKVLGCQRCSNPAENEVHLMSRTTGLIMMTLFLCQDHVNAERTLLRTGLSMVKLEVHPLSSV